MTGFGLSRLFDEVVSKSTGRGEGVSWIKRLAEPEGATLLQGILTSFEDGGICCSLEEEEEAEDEEKEEEGDEDVHGKDRGSPEKKTLLDDDEEDDDDPVELLAKFCKELDELGFRFGNICKNSLFPS